MSLLYQFCEGFVMVHVVDQQLGDPEKPPLRDAYISPGVPIDEFVQTALFQCVTL
jgi:hypothetical protein